MARSPVSFFMLNLVAGDGQGRRRTARPTRSSANRRRASTFPGGHRPHLLRADIFQAGMVHGRVVRPPRYVARRWKADDRGQVDARRDQSRARRARSLASSPSAGQAVKAREALANANGNWAELPDPANIHAICAIAAEQGRVIGVKQAPALASADTRTHEATYTKTVYWHMARSALLFAAMATFLRTTVIVCNIRRACSRCAMNSSRHEDAGKGYPLHPCRRFGAWARLQQPAPTTSRRRRRCLPARTRQTGCLVLQWMRDDESLGAVCAAMSMSVKASSQTASRHAGTICGGAAPIRMRPDANAPASAWYMAECSRTVNRRAFPNPRAVGDRIFRFRLSLPKSEDRAPFHSEDCLFRVSARPYACVALQSGLCGMCSRTSTVVLAEGRPSSLRSCSCRSTKDPRARGVGDLKRSPRWWAVKTGARPSLGRGRDIGFAKYKNLAAHVACIAHVEVGARSPARCGWAAGAGGHGRGLVCNRLWYRGPRTRSKAASFRASWTLY